MTVLVTCGPAWEPVDGMRRLTNASTGRLGTCLADRLGAAGHRVLVFRGEGSTASPPRSTSGIEVVPFTTNDDLATRLADAGARERIDVVLHAAALCDYRVARVVGADGQPVRAAKIPTRAGRIALELEPATKVLPRLAEWFPAARRVGWKFELNGTRDDALAAARRQLAEAGTHACVLNGGAWGDGFGWCRPAVPEVACPDVASLADTLVAWIAAAS